MFLLVAAVFALVGQSSVDPYTQAKAVIRSVKSWEPGAPIPMELRRFKESEGCFGEPTDTSQLLGEIENLRFLVALTVEPGVDDAVSELALNRALDLGGPTLTFELVRQAWPKSRSRRAVWLDMLSKRSAKRHVVVDGLFIQESDMPADQAARVLDRIEADLRRGKSWPEVYKAYSSEFGYATADTTKIGNLGSFVVFDDPALRRPHRWVEIDGMIEFQGEPMPSYLGSLAWLPAAHIQPILASSASDIVRLQDPGGRGLVLYQVREVYEGSEVR